MTYDRTYSEMIRKPTYLERFEYLSLGGVAFDETFGHSRFLNQGFYTSAEWKKVRRNVVARDLACDLAWPDYPIKGRLIVHHINPITEFDIIHGSDSMIDMDNLVCVSHMTHNAIHFGDRNLLPKDIVVRKPGDTKLW